MSLEEEKSNEAKQSLLRFIELHPYPIENEKRDDLWQELLRLSVSINSDYTNRPREDDNDETLSSFKSLHQERKRAASVQALIE